MCIAKPTSFFILTLHQTPYGRILFISDFFLKFCEIHPHINGCKYKSPIKFHRQLVQNNTQIIDDHPLFLRCGNKYIMWCQFDTFNINSLFSAFQYNAFLSDFFNITPLQCSRYLLFFLQSYSFFIADLSFALILF